MTGRSLDGDPFQAIAPMVTYLLSDAAVIVTGSVIDFDQTVHGPSGGHVPPARTGAPA